MLRIVGLYILESKNALKAIPEVKALINTINAHSFNVAQKDEIFADYEKRDQWKKMMLTNIAKAGYFSSDRTISEYNRDIWHLN